MKIIKYLILFLICFVAVQFALRTYYDSRTNPNKQTASSNTNQKNLTRISSPLLLDRGKIKSNIIEGVFNIKNIGEFKLTKLEVSGDCSCTDIKFSKKDLSKGGISTVYYKIDLSEDKGWFNKTIIIQGSFFPFKRLIRIEGYKL